MTWHIFPVHDLWYCMVFQTFPWHIIYWGPSWLKKCVFSISLMSPPHHDIYCILKNSGLPDFQRNTPFCFLLWVRGIVLPMKVQPWKHMSLEFFTNLTVGLNSFCSWNIWEWWSFISFCITMVFVLMFNVTSHAGLAWTLTAFFKNDCKLPDDVCKSCHVTFMRWRY
jgi:hypothetical protein